ncbi:MAG TPA: hypothetical protein VG845_02640 [Dehalococcoidia bacterium]|nr:hypothetical protein [Dehalococcoidia bacterium]
MASMNARADATRRFEEQFEPVGKTCTQPGCDHPAYISVWWAPGHFSGFMCKCCHRRSLQHRLAELKDEIKRLPGEIEALPAVCGAETVSVGSSV